MSQNKKTANTIKILCGSTSNGDKWYAINHLLELLNMRVKVSNVG